MSSLAKIRAVVVSGTICIDSKGSPTRPCTAKAKGLGRKLLREVATIVTPETLLACRREDAAVWAEGKTPDPFCVSWQFGGLKAVVGYDRMVGALANLGHSVSDQTVS